MNHGSGARNRTGMPRPKSHEKTDFGYGFGYVSLDTKNVSLDTKNVSLDTKNVSLDMVISLWIWPLVGLSNTLHARRFLIPRWLTTIDENGFWN